jgi:hypothetical protein
VKTETAVRNGRTKKKCEERWERNVSSYEKKPKSSATYVQEMEMEMQMGEVSGESCKKKKSEFTIFATTTSASYRLIWL